MTRDKAYARLYTFLKINGYDYNVEDVIKEYATKFMSGFYVCASMRLIFEENEDYITILLNEGIPDNVEGVEMPSYEVEVEIKETSIRIVKLRVSPFENVVDGEMAMKPEVIAEIIATKKYESEEIIIGPDDFYGVDISAVSIKEIEVE